jgi:hypothetical protein
MKLTFSGQFFEKSSNFMKIRPVGAVLFHTDGQTDIKIDTAKLIVAFSQFSEAV